MPTPVSALTAFELARLQFGFTISFHIIFPAITIGLGTYLVVLEGMWLATKDTVYRDLCHFWSKVFAINFGMGVVSGLVMAYQFGTNWSGFTAFAGSITGPLLTYEVLTAFFLEAGFLGVMLFGWNKVGPSLHFFSTIMVCLGTLISTTWILASNSWMQTPAGFAVSNGVVVPVSWLQVVLNPSFPYRLAHMVVASEIATGLFVGASAAWHLLKGRSSPAIRTMFSMAMWLIAVLAPIQIFVGDQHGLNTLEHQPAKIAAIEGHWQNTPGESVPLILFGWPDMAAEKTRFALEIPVLGSLVLTHSLDGKIPGLKEFPPDDRPNSTIIFWTFRIMVGLGFLMLGLGIWSLWLRWKERLYASDLFFRSALIMGPAGLIAILAGWLTTEIGRQPWVVYGVMRTKDGVSNHSVLALSISLAALVILYFAVFGTGITYMMKVIAKGPDEGGGGAQPDADADPHLRPARPLSAVADKAGSLASPAVRGD